MEPLLQQISPKQEYPGSHYHHSQKTSTTKTKNPTNNWDDEQKLAVSFAFVIKTTYKFAHISPHLQLQLPQPHVFLVTKRPFVEVQGT